MKKVLILVIFILILGCKYKNTLPQLSHGYVLKYNGMSDIGLTKEVDPGHSYYIIYGHILEIEQGPRFLVVAERPRDSVPECDWRRGLNKLEKDRAFHESKFCQYWIVDMDLVCKFDEQKKSGYSGGYTNVYGPYKKAEYLKRRIELKVPYWLELNIIFKL
jgi:hypothetical protein